MTLESGKLTDRITIQSFSSTRDSFGQPVETWADLVSLWAWVKYTNGQEFISAGQQAETQASMRIRYRTDLTTSMRVSFNSKLFNIKAVLPSSERDYVDLVVSEGLNNG
jgi:SPP1 family predicted phage head-tail adaptor